MTLFLSLLRSETAGDPQRLARALQGLRRYQEAQRQPQLPLMPAIAEVHGAVLRDYGGTGRDLLFIPSLINPPNVLDISADRSMLRWMASQGHRVLLLDWGSMTAGRAELSIGGHVEQIILPLLRSLPTPPTLVGYCLGGTMAVAAACLHDVPAMATIAAPWDFNGFKDDVREMLGSLWQGARPSTDLLNVLPMEVLQAAFWGLDPRRTVRKFEDFADAAEGSAEEQSFVTLEDWANDGPPLPAAAARELFEQMVALNVTGEGKWLIEGSSIDPRSIAAPQFHVISTTDKIVPAASCPTTGLRCELSQGHVGMIVGGRAKSALWEPLSAWLSQCSKEC